MTLRYTEPILDHLSHSAYRPIPARELAKDMRISDEDQPTFLEAIETLIKEKKLIKGPDDKLRLPSYADFREMTGIFRLNPRGFGFFIPDAPMREGDLFIPPNKTGSAVSRDRVKVAVVEDYRRRRGGVKSDQSGFIGEVIEVIERSRDNFVGVLVKDGKNWFVHPDGRIIHDPVLIRDPHVKNAKEGSKVAIELVHYPDSDYLAEGVITEVLGEAGRPDVETQAVIVAHGLRTDFPEESVQQARDVSKQFEKDAKTQSWEGREDITEQFVFTIDPPDAKDFDDAISIEYDKQRDVWTLGVHIADVSRFVTPDSPLDEEAKARGNSVYLPRLVIPMLPEILSNGVCSLQEGVIRFTKSAFITLDNKGNVVDQRAANTVIKSRKRLTYLEAQALIDGDRKEARKHTRTDTDYTDELVEKLKLSDKLARIIEKRRHRHGMIVLNLPEVELVFDEDGHVIDAVPEDDAYTHKIIEMFMVEANEAMARLFESLGIPILRRVHPDPVAHDLSELQMYALAARQRVPDEPDRKDLQRLLNATRDTPAVRAIHFAVLRTLSKASYSPAMIGHYALASEHYAHFTSPIRRYPDLTLHRAIDAFLEQTANGTNVKGGRAHQQLVDRLKSDDRVLDEAQLIELGRHCSDTEIEAEEAERELREFLVMQFLHEHHLGDEFEGVITGMANKGVYVSIERFLVDGMVSMKDLPQSEGKADRWEINEQTKRMHAKRSGQVLAIGDFVTVQIVAVDLASRHLDLLITKFPERTAADIAALPRPEHKRHGSKDDKRRGKGKGKGKSKGKGRRSRR